MWSMECGFLFRRFSFILWDVAHTSSLISQGHIKKNTFFSSGSHSSIGYLNTNFDSAWPPWNLFISASFPGLCVPCGAKTIHSDSCQVFRLLCERDPLTFTEHPIGGPLRQRVTAEPGILHSPAEAPPLLWGSALLQSLESALFLSRDF